MSRKTSPRDWFIRQSAVGGSSREPVRTSRLLLAALIFLSAIGSPLLADNAFRSTSDGSSSASPNPESGPKALFSGHASGNTDGVFLLLDYQRPVADSSRAAAWVEPTTYAEVPLSVLLPSYLLSELKIAFTIGFLVFLPFVVIDLVVSSLLVSTGVMMLPPVMVSLPLKLLLFVMIDGWFLTVGMLLQSVQVAGVTG